MSHVFEPIHEGLTYHLYLSAVLYLPMKSNSIFVAAHEDRGLTDAFLIKRMRCVSFCPRFIHGVQSISFSIHFLH